MSVLASADPIARAQAGNGNATWAALKANALPLIFCAALWAACHPYPGIVGDSRIYIGRALADLDPTGVGRDMIFVNDGQFQFSLFPIVARGLVAHLGAAVAAQFLAAIGCLSWFAAALAFAMQLSRGRALWMMLAFVCVLPHAYGNHMFFPAETLAVPRPFAEAAALAGFAALLAGRPLGAFGLALFGVLMHPLMGLPGLAIIVAVHLPGWRVIAAATACAAVSAIAGLAGVPLFDRLFTRIDADWLALLYQLDPYLFPTHWSLGDFAPLVTASATIGVAASLLMGAARRLFVTSLVIGLGGVLAAAVLGDTLHNLLAIQVQSWRSAWLIVVIAQYAYALCIIRLSTGEIRRGYRRVTLALLTLGWFGNLGLFLTLPIIIMALALHFGRFVKPLPSRYVVTVWAMVAALILCSYANVLTNFVQFLARMPSDAALGMLYGLRMDVFALPVCFAAAAWWLAKPNLRLARVLSSGVVLVCAALAAEIWTSRSEAARDFETLYSPQEFATVLADRPGEVLWVDGKSETWQVLGRAQWGSAQQSASVVFSRPLAMLWRERAQALLDNGLIQGNVFLPWTPIDKSAIPNVTRQALDNICARDDAPVAIIFPLEAGRPVLADVMGAIWTLPHPRFLSEINEKNIWHKVDRYAAVPCGDKTKQSALRGGLL
jgi:hypothetical protein